MSSTAQRAETRIYSQQFDQRAETSFGPSSPGGRLCLTDRQTPLQRRRRRKDAAAPSPPAHQCRPDAERFTYLQCARAALMEAQDAVTVTPLPHDP
jgi:hypothetical protein